MFVRGIVSVLALVLVGSAAASSIDLDPPAEGQVLDLADLLDPAQEAGLQQRSDALLREHRTPLVVVTITSMAAHWSYGDIRIETFAHLLFDRWRIGFPTVAGETWNTGILLIVSRDDRRARIQLGAGWGRDQDAACQRIMDRIIIPAFKRGNFGDGIVAGAAALDDLARGKPLPAASAAPAGPSRGVNPGPGGWVPLVLASVVAVVPLVLAIGFGFMMRRATHRASQTVWVAKDGVWRRESIAAENTGFWVPFFANMLGAGGTSGSLGGGSGVSSGGAGGGGFSGGGFSGGGGASGGW